MANISMDTRLRLCHGVFQRLAESAGIDVLHVKGPAVSAALLANRVDATTGERCVVPRPSSDVDLLVRPRHVGRFLALLGEHGWQRKTSFESGSAFGHALNVYHPRLGNADVHRFFPGIGLDPEPAFDELWADHSTTLLGNVACPVPSVTAQRLLLLLHAGRSGGQLHPDYALCWQNASMEERGEVRVLAERFEARVGLAAAIGELDHYLDDPQYLLWRHFANERSSGRFAEWRARLRAARTWRDKASVLRGFFIINRDFVAMQVGHEPTHRDLAHAYADRIATMLGELRDATRRRVGRRP